MKIVVPGREIAGMADPALLKAIARGHAWFEELATGRATTISQLAAREKVTDRYVSSLINLAFLAPALVESRLRRVPGGVSAKILVNDLDLPMIWSDQAHALAPGSE
jgi:site-specific DNA recombinase